VEHYETWFGTRFSWHHFKEYRRQNADAMKQRIHLERIRATRWLLAFIVACTALAFMACDDDDDPVDTRSYTISGDASGSQVVPGVSGTGTGTISGTYDPNTRVLTYQSGWNGLTGAPSSGGFYIAARGSNGVAVGSPWTFDPTATATGTTSGTMTLTEAQGAQLTAGNWYYSYGTLANEGGEIRGQIAAER
jgi:hypothetical protein